MNPNPVQTGLEPKKNIIMKHLSFLLLIALQLSHFSLSAQKTIVDNNAQVRPVGAFEAIHVSNSFDIFLSQAPEHALVVSASDVALRDQIETEVKNGTLYIRLKKSGVDWKSNRKLRAYVSAPDLKKIELSGSSDLQIDNVFKAEDLEIRISGSSDFKGNIEGRNLRLNSSGSSDFRMGGKVENMKVNLSGSSDMNAYELTVDNCDITCSGASDVQITVNKELKVNVSGASNVSYKGTAVVKEMKTSGSSSLKKRD
jgi:hypothetical protein